MNDLRNITNRTLPILAMLALVTMLLAACGGADPTPTPVPPTESPPTEVPATEVPATEEPSPESISVLDTFDLTPDPMLINKAWQWERRDPNGNSSPAIEVPNPENYVLYFKEDGTFEVTIDCNNGSGIYATEGIENPQSRIYMKLGPMTMAACEEGSFAPEMSQMFGPAQSYEFLEDGEVVKFAWAGAGPVDYFRIASFEGSGSVLDTFDFSADPNLIDKTWAWESRDPNDNSSPAIDVPDPENYTLVFSEDGTFVAQLDCNDGNGMYATESIESQQPRIFMELGPTTIAFCGEDSLDIDMANMFGPAQSYEFLEDGEVVKFAWAGAGPIDYFRNVTSVDLPDPGEGAAVGTVTAPDGVFLRTGPGTDYPYVGAAPFEETGEIIGVSEDGFWWLADAPNLPEGEVWVSAEWVEVTGGENVPVVAAPPVEPILTGTPWEWVSTTDPAQGTVSVNDPSRYVILFNDDGTAAIQADCNNVGASYKTDGINISITTGPSTMVACPSDSLDSQFLAQLTSAAIYFIEGGNLYLDLPTDSGTMRFVPQGTPPPEADAPAGEGDGLTFYLVSYGPQGAENPLIEGTQITASFADDVVTGNSGCNNYSGALTPVDDHFTVGPILTSRQFCAEPAGMMDQEQAYLTALESIGGYRWEQTRESNGALVTRGQLFYSLPDGTDGAMNFTTSP